VIAIGPVRVAASLAVGVQHIHGRRRGGGYAHAGAVVDREAGYAQKL